MLSRLKVVAEAKPATTKTHHVWIWDRSHSMHWTIKGLVKDMIEHRKTLREGDLLSIGWFSSEGGKFSWSVVCHVVSQDSLSAIEKVLNANAFTVGLTCFSEILGSLSSILDDAASFSPQATLLHFFTDGYPVVTDEALEEQHIYTALTALAPKLTAALFIGYGDYYNRTLLAQMASVVDGAVIHASNLETYGAEVRNSSQGVAPRHEVQLTGGILSAFYIRKGQVVPATIDSTDRISIPLDVAEVWVDDLTRMGEFTDDVLPGAYGMAVLKLQQGRQDEAIAVLGATGDVALIEAVNNAFTIEELGACESALRDAIKFPKRRFMLGKKSGYVPDPDALCLIDVLEKLADNPNTRFYPHDPRFSYKRTGVPSTPMEGYPKFIKAEANPAATFQPEWAKTRANVNLQAKINGVIDLGANDVGLDAAYYTHQFREYTIIKDGVLHTTTIAISTTRALYDWLKSVGVVDNGVSWKANQPYAVNFAGMPMINRSFINNYRNISQLETNAKLEIAKMAALKVYKALLKELQPEKPFTDGTTPEQGDFLRSKGVTPNGFNPPKIKAEAEDYYYAKTFEVQVVGLSSLPSMADLRKKLESGKPLTKGQALMDEHLKKYEALTNGRTDQERIEWLNKEIANQNATLELARTYIRHTMFAVIVGKMWFPELGGRRDGATYGELVFKFDSQVKVGY